LAVQELDQNRDLSAEGLLSHMVANPRRLFSIAIERLEQRRADWPICRLALGFLLVAGEPLVHAVLQRLISGAASLLFDRDLRQALHALGGLLIRDSTGRSSLFHAKFRDYLAQNAEAELREDHLFTPAEVADVHRQVADWCAPGAEDTIWHAGGAGIEPQRRAYARTHYITHLYGSGDDARLWQVLDDGRYGRQKIAHDPSTYTYAPDLNLGRRSAARSDLSVVAAYAATGSDGDRWAVPAWDSQGWGGVGGAGAELVPTHDYEHGP
jgi:hypothetical protein